MTPSNENMGKVKSEIGSILLAVTRGDTPLNALRDIGIEIDLKDDGFYSFKSALEVEVTPTVADLATGILRYRSGKGDELRKWAFFLLAETAIDFCNIESHSQGEVLINALWDASFEGGISSEVIEAAEMIKWHSRVD